MDFTEIKTGIGQKRNKIVLKDLGKRQKELLMSGGIIASGVGIGSGLFSLYSMSEPEVIPVMASDSTDFNEGAVAATLNTDVSQTEDVAFYTEKPVASMVQNEVSFAEAFQVARSEVGAGGWFIWKEKIFNTYYKEEWENMTSGEKNDYLATLKAEDLLPGTNDMDQPILTATAVVTDDGNDEVPLEKVADATRAATLLLEHDEVSSPVNQIINIPDTPEQINIEVTEPLPHIDFNANAVNSPVSASPMEFDLPEDSIIYEIPASDIGTLDSIVIDAAESNNLWFAKNEKLETMSPIDLKNLGHDVVADNIGLEHNRANDVVEYPWGEPIIKVEQHPEVSDSNLKDGSAPQIEVLNSNKEETEYPWGEPMVKLDNVSFAHDIKIVGHDGPVPDNENAPHNNAAAIDEYPWGEPVVNQTDNQAPQEDTMDDCFNSDLENLVQGTDEDFDLNP